MCKCRHLALLLAKLVALVALSVHVPFIRSTSKLGRRGSKRSEWTCTAEYSTRWRNTVAPKDTQYDDGLAFIHIAKAGGTSLRTFFQNLALECGYNSYVDEEPFWKDLTEQCRSEVQVYCGTNHLGYYDLIRTWPGHAHRNTAFFTQLRHPWDRAASDYHYVKSLGPLHHLFELTKTQNATEWIHNTRDGGQLSYFVPVANGDTSQRRCCFDRAELEEAKELLRQRFVVVGILEEPKMTVEVLQCRVPWIRRAVQRNANLANLPHLNERILNTSSEVDGNTVQMALARKHLFPLDWELYEYSRSLLREHHAECLKQGLVSL